MSDEPHVLENAAVREPNGPVRRWFRRGCLVVSLNVLLLPLAVFALTVLVTSFSSWSARGYALAILSIYGAPFVQQARRMVQGGAGLFVVVIVLRMVTAAQGSALTMTCSGSQGRLLARVIDERDAAIWGARIAFASGRFRDPDTPAVVPALIRGYAELAAQEGDVPSPVLPTYLGMERPHASDVIAFDAVTEKRGAVLFLHGFGGGFALPCWQLAQTVAKVGFITRCPSLGPHGDWWSADGEAIVRETIHELQAEGTRHIVLAGLSNGGIGAARLAPRLRGSIHGLVLIAGTASASFPGVPVLVLQGARDAMMPAAGARAYADLHHGTYVELKGGHFALMLEREHAMDALTRWLTFH